MVIIEYSQGKLSPELSYGTHFFGDISATNTLYIPLFIEKGDEMNIAFLDSAESAIESKLVKLITAKPGFRAFVDGIKKEGVIAKQYARNDKNGGPTAI